MKKVILNCDDFGLDTNTNRHIISLIENKKISSASILVKRNIEAMEEAVNFAKIFNRDVSFGLHLDLDEYFKFDQNGFWGRDENHIINNYKDIFEKNKEVIILDIEKQFSTLKESGVEISHVDGHHNIHLFEDILFELVKVMKKYKVNKMRFINEFYLTNKKLEIIKKLLYENNIATPDNFIDDICTNDEMYSNKGISEVMIHVFFNVNNVMNQYQKLLEEETFKNYEIISYKQL